MSQAQVLPKELRLIPPPTMPQARSYLFKQQSTLSTYAAGETIQINIPRLQRSYLTKDSYLKFKLTVNYADISGTAGSTIALDTAGAYGLIDKIEVYDYLGSTLLESTSGHGQLMATLLDISTSNIDRQNHLAANSGTLEGGVITKISDTGKFQTQIPSQCGKILATKTTSAALNAETTCTFEFGIPLFSFIGLLSTKFAPLHNGYTINITLNSLNKCIKSFNIADVTTAEKVVSSISVSYVNYCCQILELGPVAESMLLSSTQGMPLIIPTKAYRNYVGNVDSESSSYKLDLNLNVASLTNLLWIMRPTTILDDQNYSSLSWRIRNYLQSWYFQYGSSVLPQTSGIIARGRHGDSDDDAKNNGFIEAYNELMKSRHNFNSENWNTSIDPEYYKLDVGTNYVPVPCNTTTNAADGATEMTTKVRRGQFAAGIDLELVSGRSNDIVCGLNTNGMNTSINLTFDSTLYSSVVAARLDCWCEYDAFINISPGIATTVSF